MSEAPKTESKSTTEKETEASKLLESYIQALNARLTRTEIDIPTYQNLEGIAHSLTQEENPHHTLNALLTGKKRGIKLEDFQELRKIADKVVEERAKKKEAPKIQTRDEVLQEMLAAMGRKDEEETARLSALLKTFGEPPTPPKTSGPDTTTPLTPEPPPVATPETRDELIRQMNAAMGSKNRAEVNRLSELLRAMDAKETTSGPDQVVNELANETPEIKEKIRLGLHNFGFFAEEQKNKLWARVFSSPLKFIDEKRAAGRFFLSLKENFERDAKKAHAELEKSSNGKKRRLASTGNLVGNVLKYGRTVADIAGWTVASPFRYVTMGGMFFARGAEAVKEAHFKNEEVLKNLWIESEEQAAEEAWRIYEEAKGRSEGNAPSRDDLQRTYHENLPKELLERLKEDPEAGVTTGILGRILEKDITGSIRSIERKLEEIEKKDISKKGKNQQKDKLLKKYEKHLRDLDRIVDRYGIVDGLALGAKYGETAGKAVVGGLMAESVVLLAQNLWEKGIPEILSRSAKFNIKNLLSILSSGDEKTSLASKEPFDNTPYGDDTSLSFREETPIHHNEWEFPEGRPEDHSGLSPDAARTEAGASFIETVKRGDSVWKITERKLGEVYGEKFANLNEAQKTFVIDVIKEKIVENPKTYGIESGDVNLIHVGDKINFGDILQDKSKVEKLFATSQALDETAQRNIVAMNERIAEWVSTHPGERLTNERLHELAVEREEALVKSEPGRFGDTRATTETTGPETKSQLGTFGDTQGTTETTPSAGQRIPDPGTPPPVTKTPEKFADLVTGMPLSEREFFLRLGVTEDMTQSAGSPIEAYLTRAVGLLDLEYKAISKVSVGKILEEIYPAGERALDPNRVIDLPYYMGFDQNEFEAHIRLARFLQAQTEKFPQSEYLKQLTVEDFFKSIQPHRIPTSGQLEDILNSDLFADSPKIRPEETPPPSSPGESAGPTATKPEGIVNEISEKEVQLYGSTEEAFIGKRLSYNPGEWQKVRDVRVNQFLIHLPKYEKGMSAENLWETYKRMKPVYVEASDYNFGLFQKHLELSKILNQYLISTPTNKDYLEKQPIREVIKIIIEQKSKKLSEKSVS